MRWTVAAALIFGCTSPSATAIDAHGVGDGSGSGSGSGSATFVLTSTDLVEGAAFDPKNTCDGVDTSVALAWTDGGGPSYAVTLTDESISLVHWIIYNIPSSATGLPEGVDNAAAPTKVPGAHQTKSFDNKTDGYLGPCPPAQHTYRLDVYALDVAMLPETLDRTTAVGVIQQHVVTHAMLSGTYMH